MANINWQAKNASGDNLYPVTYAENVLNRDGTSIQNLVDNLIDENIVSDAYDPTSTYAVGDYCIYNNALYKCNTAVSTAEAWNSSHWTATQVDNELTSLKSDLTNLNSSDVTNSSNISGATVTTALNEINTILSISTPSTGITGASASKYGKIVTLTGAFSNKQYTAVQWYSLGTLNSAVRPKTAVVLAGINNQTDKSVHVTISTAGALQFWNDTANQNMQLQFTCTYLVS